MGFAQRLLGFLARRHVDDGRLGGGLALPRDRPHPVLQPDQGPVLALPLGLVGRRRHAALHARLRVPREPRPFVRRHDFQCRLQRQDFLDAVVTEDLDSRLVDEKRFEMALDDVSLDRALDQVSEAFLAFRQRRFGAFAFADVLSRPVKPYRGAVAVAGHRTEGIDVPDIAVRTHDPVLVVKGAGLVDRVANGFRHPFPVIGMQQFLEHREADRACGRQSEDFIGLVIPSDLVGGQIPLPTAEARHALRLGQPGRVLAQFHRAPDHFAAKNPGNGEARRRRRRGQPDQDDPDGAFRAFARGPFGIENRAFGIERPRDQAGILEKVMHVSPPPGIDVSQFDDMDVNQLAHRTDLKPVERLEVGDRRAMGQVAGDTIGNLLGMGQGVRPSSPAGGDEAFDGIGVFLDPPPAGEQCVAVEIDAIGGRPQARHLQSRLAGQPASVDEIAADHVRLALGEVAEPPFHFDEGDGGRIDALGPQHGPEFGFPDAAQPAQGDAQTRQIGRRCQPGFALRVECLAALLEEAGENRKRRPLVAGHQDVCAADTEIGPTLGNLAGDAIETAVRANARADLHVEAGLAVVALPQGGVVAGELELVVPDQLQDHLALFPGIRRPR